MKKISKNSHVSILKKIVVISLIIIIFIPSLYLGVGLFIFSDMTSFNNELEDYYWPDSENYAYVDDREFNGYFINARWDYLEARAYNYEDWTDQYSICQDDWECSTTICETYFEYGMTSPFSDFSKYQAEVNDFINNGNSKYRKIREVNPVTGHGDTPMWTGNYLASLTFHYAVECRRGNVQEVNEILRKIERPVAGLHILTHVTGLDGNLARFAVKDTLENRARFENFFCQNGVEKDFGQANNRFPGQGDYEGWWYEDTTSRDQHLGLFFGYGITYKILSETTCPSGVDLVLRDSILNTIANDGSDVLDCLMGANWHVIAGEAEPGDGRGFHEASLFPRVPWTSGGELLLGFLAFGKMVNPSKYTKYFDEMVNRFVTTIYSFSMDQSGAYYGNNLAFDGLFQAYFLIEDPGIRELLRHHYNNDFYTYVQYHRNSLFNIGYLIFNEWDINDVLNDEKLKYRLDDITDNLDRFATWRFPSRNWYIPAVEDWQDWVHPKAKMYSEIFRETDSTNPLIYSLYNGIFGEFSDTSAKMSFALGLDELPSEDFFWQRSPFAIGGNHPDNPDRLGDNQRGGIDYTIVYWMSQYYGYFE